MRVRKHIWFSGRVQGVGFRWTASRLTGSLGLTGWVENLWDGRVEMEVQGEDLAVQELLIRLRDQPHIQIDSIEMEDLPPLEQETRFSVKGY